MLHLFLSFTYPPAVCSFEEKTIDMLIQLINPVQDSFEAANKISELGIMVVISGVMVISFISMGVFIFRQMQNTNKKIVESQSTIIAQNDTIKSLLTRIAETESDEAKLEQTRYNVERLLSSSFDTNLVDLVRGVNEILTYNHIDEKEFTDTRIRDLVENSHTNRVKWLNSFKYKGTRLGELADSEKWKDRKIKIIKTFIYSPDHNMNILIRNLSQAYTEFKNKITF